jgi:ABC-type nickel/cobalt efflux system permease component RcnA
MNVLLATSSGLINWGLLGRIFVMSAGISVGLVVLFTLAVNSLSAFRREGGPALSRSVNAAIVAVTSVAIVATLVWGLYYIVHK